MLACKWKAVSLTSRGRSRDTRIVSREDWSAARGQQCPSPTPTATQDAANMGWGSRGSNVSSMHASLLWGRIGQAVWPCTHANPKGCEGLLRRMRTRTRNKTWREEDNLGPMHCVAARMVARCCWTAAWAANKPGERASSRERASPAPALVGLATGPCQTRKSLSPRLNGDCGCGDCCTYKQRRLCRRIGEVDGCDSGNRPP